ncbi:hypothetical protein [Campylobacter gracilis]
MGRRWLTAESGAYCLSVTG